MLDAICNVSDVRKPYDFLNIRYTSFNVRIIRLELSSFILQCNSKVTHLFNFSSILNLCTSFAIFYFITSKYLCFFMIINTDFISNVFSMCSYGLTF